MSNDLTINYKLKKKNYEFWLKRLNTKSSNLVCSKDERLNNFENEFLIKNIKANKSILEIGCGNAILLRKLLKKKKVKFYLGTDFVKELIEQNKKKNKKKKYKF